ncbi:hypothetical protein BH10PSE7_BH10PSE7_18520 [soil metagenome]
MKWTSALIASSLMAAISVTEARSDPLEWTPTLKSQLHKTEGCEMMYMTDVKEYRLLDHDIVEARAHCDDGRSFDAVRRDRKGPWKTVACKPLAC